MAPTLFFFLIIALLVLAAALLYGRSTPVNTSEAFIEDRLSKFISTELIDDVKTYANRTNRSFQDVVDQALREFLNQRNRLEGNDPIRNPRV